MKLLSLNTSLAIPALTTLGTRPAFSNSIIYRGGNMVTVSQSFSSKPSTSFNTGVATIGDSVSTPSYDALVAVGYHQQTRNINGNANQKVGFDITSFEVTGEAVPEPSTWALLGAGASLAPWRAARRSQH